MLAETYAVEGEFGGVGGPGFGREAVSVVFRAVEAERCGGGRLDWADPEVEVADECFGFAVGGFLGEW